jgi:hypothetical protein
MEAEKNRLASWVGFVPRLQDDHHLRRFERTVLLLYGCEGALDDKDQLMKLRTRFSFRRSITV